jgi:hypothetical protein
MYSIYDDVTDIDPQRTTNHEYIEQIHQFCKLYRKNQAKLTLKFQDEFIIVCKHVSACMKTHTNLGRDFYRRLIPSNIIVDYLDDPYFINDYKRIVHRYEEGKRTRADDYEIVLLNLTHRLAAYNINQNYTPPTQYKEQEQTNKKEHAEKEKDAILFLGIPSRLKTSHYNQISTKIHAKSCIYCRICPCACRFMIK